MSSLRRRPFVGIADAADLFQQAGNRYKIEQRWRDAGVAFEKEAGARMQAGEANDAISECAATRDKRRGKFDVLRGPG